MSKGLKALKEVGKILGDMSVDTNGMPKFVLEGNRAKLYKTIEKELKALEIIKENFEITVDKIDDETSFIEITRKGSNNKCFKIVENELAYLLKEVLKNED